MWTHKLILVVASVVTGVAQPPAQDTTGEAASPVAAGSAFPAGGFDYDGDGVLDVYDNCIETPNPPQRDTDGDLFGNYCDADFDNNCIVNFSDLAYFRMKFMTRSEHDADFNGDGRINFADLVIIRAGFMQPPGPSALTDACDGGPN